MQSVEHHVGRLIEIRLAPPLTLDELKELRQLNGGVITSLSKKAVVCSDLRALLLFPPQQAEQFLSGARTLNQRIERSAFLLPARAVFTLQMERIIREARSDARKTFTSRYELEPWLGEILDADERARLSVFLGG